jgi:uncharacterized RDD family membrane protein YckC
MPTDDYGKVEITYDMLADRGKRFANNLIDQIIYIILTILIALLGNWLLENYGFRGLAVGDLATLQDHPFRFNILQLFISVIFYGLFESLLARTPAKYITGTKVVMRDGTKPDSTAIFIRTLCRQIPFEAITFLFGRFPIGWHDAFSKTLVVDVYKYNAALRRKDDTRAANDTENE